MPTPDSDSTIQPSLLPRCDFHARQISEVSATPSTLVPQDVIGPLLFRISDPLCCAPEQGDGSFIAPAFNKINAPPSRVRDANRFGAITDREIVTHILNPSRNSRFISTTPLFWWTVLHMEKRKSSKGLSVSVLRVEKIPQDRVRFALAHIDPKNNEKAYDFAKHSQEILVFEAIPASAHLATFTFDKIKSLLSRHAQWASLKDRFFSLWDKRTGKRVEVLESFKYYAREWHRSFHAKERYSGDHVDAVADTVIDLFKSKIRGKNLRASHVKAIKAFAFHLLEWPYRAEPEPESPKANWVPEPRRDLDPAHTRLLFEKLDNVLCRSVPSTLTKEMKTTANATR
jgi:hypothetical protein